MIAYNKTDAQAVFTMLADILKKVAATNFGDNQPIGNADLPNEIKRIVDADPTANTIRTAFEKAWDIAARAGDAETERELHTRHTDLIADFNAIDSADDQEGAGETYQRHLRSHAAWILAVSASIDDSGNRPDMKAADGDEIARKVADAVRNELKDIQDDVSDTLGEAHRARVVELEKCININSQMLAKLDEVQGEAHGAKVAAEHAEDRAGETKSLVKAHLTPRHTDYQVTQKQLAEMLTAKYCKRDKRTIIRWEQYLKTDGEKGTKPPAGYTLQTRLTLQTAAAWVESFSAKEIGKLKTKISFDDRFGRT